MAEKKRRKLSRLERKIIAASLTALVLLALSIGSYLGAYLYPREKRDKEEALASRLENIATEINSLSRERLHLAIGLAREGELIQSILYPPDKRFSASKEEEEKFISKFLSHHVESFPFVVGAGFFYEPFAFDTKEKFRGFYARWVPPLGMSRKVEFTMSRSTPQADYHNTEWYRALIPNGWNPKRHLYADNTWTDPYRDSVTLVPMISVLSAMYDDDGSLIGLSSVDWNLDELTEVIDKSRVTENAIAALFSPNTKKFAAVAGLQGLNLQPIERARWMPYLLFNAPSDRYEMVTANDVDGTPLRVYSRSLENGLIYSIVIPEHEIFAEVFSESAKQLLFFTLLFLLLMFLLALYLKQCLSPIKPVNEVALQYAQGNFSNTPFARTNDEIQSISESLADIRNHIEGVTLSVTKLTEGDTIEINEHVDSSQGVAFCLNRLAATMKDFTEELDILERRIVSGETAARMDVGKFSGVWKNAAKSINQVVAVFDSLLGESISLCKEAHEGNFSSNLQGTRAGVLESFRKGINGVFKSHRKITKELSANLEATKVAREEALLAARIKNQLLNQVSEEAPALVKQSLHLLSSLRPQQGTAVQESILKEVHGTSGKVLALFEQLSGFMQLEEGRVDLLRVRFNLHSLLFDLKDILRLQTIRRRQELSLVIDEQVPEFVIGDASVIQSILLGLGTQSVKCTEEEGCISIRVKLVETTADTHTIEFTISDSGGAVFEELRNDALSWLKKGKSDEERPGMSGGLSLVIATRLAELMGGSLIFTSPQGAGAQCHLRIQVLDPESSKDTESEELMAAVSSEAVEGQKLNVLVVEDDILSQKYLVKLLHKHGCRSVAVGDGQEALYMLDQQHFDLILMDITLPTLDGIETTKRIRTSPHSYSTVPIVAVTAHPLNVETSKISDRGFNAYLLKPLSSSALKEILNSIKFLTNRSGSSEEGAILNH